jgi:hypothetical protein
LLRRAKAGELALIEAAQKVIKEELPTSETLALNLVNVLFTDEMKMIAGAKGMTLIVINDIASAYGDRARDEQEHLGLLADMVIDIYAMESALLRTQKLVDTRGVEAIASQIEITQIFTREAAERVERAARLIAVETEDEDGRKASLIDLLALRAPIKAIAARRHIADAMIEAGRYNL